MIYVIDMTRKNDGVWGSVITQEFAVPSRMHRIRGIVGNVTLAEKNSWRALWSKSGEEYEVHGISQTQLGTFSISLDGTGILVADAPIHGLSLLRKSSMRRNMIRFDKAISVKSGSRMRLILDECYSSPFTLPSDVANTDGSIDREKEAAIGKAGIGYRARIYIDYD